MRDPNMTPWEKNANVPPPQKKAHAMHLKIGG